MDDIELAVNIRILEHLGWFVAESEPELFEDEDNLDNVLLVCRPDGSVLDRVPINDFLLSYYDEESGSLEQQLWFFAPKYSTSVDNIWRLIQRDGERNLFVRFYGPFEESTHIRTEDDRYSVEITHNYFSDFFGNGRTPALAYCKAYLNYENYHSRQSNN